ncbi:MAG: hypothetical protein NVS2B16_18860 [Chloroflexota bacterium]
MQCPACQSRNPATEVLARAIEGGRAYTHACMVCGRVLDVRPRTDDDPPVLPINLSRQEIDRLRFVQWRLGSTARARLMDTSDNAPRSAA